MEDVPNIGFTGDQFYRAGHVDSEYVPYEYAIMSIDPSGRGRDETGYSVIKQLHGKIFISEVGGLLGGYTPENLTKMAMIAKKHQCKLIVVESNFGDGMFSELLKPVLRSIYPCSIEEVRNNKQKEMRIIDVIEPLLNSHKLVIDASLVRNDIKEALADYTRLPYSLIHQLTHISKDRGSLGHDDRLDALSMSLGFIVESVGVSSEDALARYKEEQLDADLERFMQGVGAGGRVKSTNYLDSFSVL
jgi:hypothetical protein